MFLSTKTWPSNVHFMHSASCVVFTSQQFLVIKSVILRENPEIGIKIAEHERSCCYDASFMVSHAFNYRQCCWLVKLAHSAMCRSSDSESRTDQWSLITHLRRVFLPDKISFHLRQNSLCAEEVERSIAACCVDVLAKYITIEWCIRSTWCRECEMLHELHAYLD